jgi:iron(III) transport system substrate-binding protein
LTEAHAGHFTPDVFESDGQELVKQRRRVPSSKAIDSPLNKFQYRMIDPAMVLDASAKRGNVGRSYA